MQPATSVPIPDEEKRAALEAALASELFARSAQLRQFLRYVCEREIGGRTDEISEYAIGIEALGRREGYSAAEDSAVRSRAYELRQRLEKFYQTEAADSAIRIAIPKGSYIPIFTRHEPHTEVPAEPARALVVSPPPAIDAIRWKRIALAAGLLALMFAIGDGVLLLNRSLRHDPGYSALAEAWGPLARADGDVLICIATKLHLLVRPHLPRVNEYEKRFPVFDELYPLFRTHRPLPPDGKLMMETADSSVTFGEMSAISVTTNALSRFGTSYSLMPERIAPLATLRNRNAVVIGIPMDSYVVSTLLNSTIYTIDYDPGIDELAIIDRRAPFGAPRYGAVTAHRGKVTVVYGLITVLPSEGNAGTTKRTIVLSGLGGVGTNGAADFFSSPEHIKGLREQFRRRGIHSFPPAYQVVVRCNFSDGLLLSTECLTFEVLPRAAG
jgi:hypothetical protein